ncbi:hypothetical protein QAD02_005605 [Eretmocerus hayati]|uniref:Uncharacterized protein n=1 Tax=Eretmocerus hayati TaxID=131215 RepID=A0ACC2NTZ5_9HYME|nr:hypothetical protein QAD02_005605 [Eretmocerus hayati]
MHYLDVSLDLPEKLDNPLTATSVKTQLILAIKKFLGTEGASGIVDILKFDASRRRLILRCHSDDYVRLRAALTLATIFEGSPCTWNINRASPNLLSFTADSRTYKHC